MPGPPGSGDENRIARRQRVLKQGKILHLTELSGTDCTVRDLSETGAKIVCSDSAARPF